MNHKKTRKSKGGSWWNPFSTSTNVANVQQPSQWSFFSKPSPPTTADTPVSISQTPQGGRRKSRRKMTRK